MTGLESLSVNKVPEILLAALSGLSLRELEVTGEERLPMRALEALGDLRRLEFRAAAPMDLDGAPLNFPALEALDVRGLRCESLECLSGLSQLTTLSISESAFERFDGLDGLQRLERIVCTESQADALRARYPDRDWTLSR